jgi:hypothetical protein
VGRVFFYLGGEMSASRKEYMTDLLNDIDDVLADNRFEGYEDNAMIVAALIIADSLNGLRKSLLTVQGGLK